MKVRTLEIQWHDQKPIYSVHFQQTSRGRLATAGGDDNIRLWQVVRSGQEPPKVMYLTTLSRHTGAVNVVRFSPKGDVLASAGDDGNVMLWALSEKREERSAFQLASEDQGADLETWKIKSMTRGMNSEIYDLAWSPDGEYMITGCMDNTARIFSGHDGQCLRQIVDHNHYVQGVAWDPLGEYIATQSSDRSVHIYQFVGKGNDVSLKILGRNTNLEGAAREKPAEIRTHVDGRGRGPSPSPSATSDASDVKPQPEGFTLPSPVPSQSPIPLPPTSTQMQPPPHPPSRRSSFSGSESRRSASPLPAVKSPKTTHKRFRLYHDDTLVSFFRRLTFTPDGALLLTPAGQFKSTVVHPEKDASEDAADLKHTVYIYARDGLTKQPVGHLPGHKLPSVVVRCSPVIYEKRALRQPTVRHPIEEGSKAPSPNAEDIFEQTSVFDLPYRMIFAVATQDTVLIYDTQQQTPLCVLGNLHYATFTDLAWSADGRTLMLSSTDGYCSIVAFDEGELGNVYTGPMRAGGPDATPTVTATATATATISGDTTVLPASPVPKLAVAKSESITNASPVPAPSPPNPPKRQEQLPANGPSKKRRIQLTFEGNL